MCVITQPLCSYTFILLTRKTSVSVEAYQLPYLKVSDNIYDMSVKFP